MTTQLLSDLRLRLREKHLSGEELWVAPKRLRLYLHPQRAPRDIHDLLRAAFDNGVVCGRDSEQLRISAEYKIPLDDLIFGAED